MATLNMALLAGNRDSSGFVSGSSTAARFNYLQAVHWHAPEGVLLTAESSAFALRAVYPSE